MNIVRLIIIILLVGLAGGLALSQIAGIRFAAADFISPLSLGPLTDTTGSNSRLLFPISQLLTDPPGPYYPESAISPDTAKQTLLIAILIVIAGLFLIIGKKDQPTPNSPLLVLKLFTGYFFISAGLGTLLGVLYLLSPFVLKNRVFSPYTLLTSSWDNYKLRFLNADGRVIDYSQGDVTTSEAQSYALLQSVWLDDKPTFDLVWHWTMTTLGRPTDHLFGWRWGKHTDGSYGLLPNGGSNTASDADSDIALSLILAYRRWHQPLYLTAAQNILTDMWRIDVDQIHGQNYLIAGNWAIRPAQDILNPSYFAPYAWRVFAQVDSHHPWLSLVKPAYTLLETAGATSLNSTQAIGLPPDWLSLDKGTGNLTTTNLPGLTTDYTYDAIRVPWRIALDYQLNRSPEALAYLKTLNRLYTAYSQSGQLPAGFTHSGTVTASWENPAMYATSLGYFMLDHPQVASTIYQTKIIRLYSNTTNSFDQNLPYYDTNWLWFGSALYLHYLSVY